MGESASPEAASKGNALPTGPADVWLQSYGPCEAPLEPFVGRRTDGRRFLVLWLDAALQSQ